MRSYALSILEPDKVNLSAWIAPVFPDPEQVEAELRRVVLPYVRWEPAEEAQAGDLAVCRTESELPRFQKNRLKLLIGSGMFHSELEQAVIGMTPGNCRAVALPEGEVLITLLELSRQKTPEPDDEMIHRLGLDGIDTVEAYRAYLFGKLRRDKAAELLPEPLSRLIREVIGGSEFVLCREDWESVVRMHIERSRILFRQEGIDMERAKPEDFRGRIPVQSYYELLALEQSEAWQNLCLYLLGRNWAGIDGYVPEKTQYEENIKNYCKTWHASEENAREANTWEAFVFSEYVSHAVNRLEKTVMEQLLREDG